MPAVRQLPRVRVPAHGAADATTALLDAAGVHTVCQEAACPNRWECFGRNTATFLVLGTVCTRRCAFCNVTSGVPAPPDQEEPGRVANAALQLRLSHVVITSVSRDDLADGGAHQFVATINAVRAALPDAAIEVLVPDFAGEAWAIDLVLDARPEVFNHNVETVERLTPVLRNGAAYLRSLAVLEHAARRSPGTPVKSGIMVGVGESAEEVHATIRDLRSAGCRILTIGQYLSPSKLHHPVHELISDDQFAHYRAWAHDEGFSAVAASPLVRSSYQAAHSFLSLPKEPHD